MRTEVLTHMNDDFFINIIMIIHKHGMYVFFVKNQNACVEFEFVIKNKYLTINQMFYCLTES